MQIQHNARLRLFSSTIYDVGHAAASSFTYGGPGAC
jgi:hypothetical protein